MKITIKCEDISYFTDVEDFKEVIESFTNSESDKSEFVMLKDIVVRRSDIAAVFATD